VIDDQARLLHDSVTFPSVAEQLFARCRALSEAAKAITLVFDKGNDSEDNLRLIDEGRLHFVGSLVPTQHPDLLATATLADAATGAIATACGLGLPHAKAVFGVNRTIVVTFNRHLFRAQEKTPTREINKRPRKRQLPGSADLLRHCSHARGITPRWIETYRPLTSVELNAKCELYFFVSERAPTKQGEERWSRGKLRKASPKRKHTKTRRKSRTK